MRFRVYVWFRVYMGFAVYVWFQVYIGISGLGST